MDQTNSALLELQQYIDLASERVGGTVLFANDEFFAPKENLVRAPAPVFAPHEYTDRGKWMDGWESRRKRIAGHDFCILRLGLPGIIKGLIIDTSYFIGNYPEQCSVEACVAPPATDAEHLMSPSTEWTEVLPRAPLEGNSQNIFLIDDPRRFTHLRLHIYPDGGIARLRAHGLVVPDWKRARAPGEMVDLAAAEYGGQVLACSDMFFGDRSNLIMPGRALNMGDGWETRRRRGAGHDWAMVQLGAPGIVRRIEVDTNHFKGNYPDTCSIEGCYAEGATVADLTRRDWAFRELLPRTKLAAHTRHFFVEELRDIGEVTHVRLNIFPDGGVSRLRLHGEITKHGLINIGLLRLNTMSHDHAVAELRACCASQAWLRGMADKRPFRSADELYEGADDTWRSLRPEDWIEAFRAHPRIGEREPVSREGVAIRKWSTQNQSALKESPPESLGALAEINRQYEAKFGFVFIISAAGKNAEQILESARRRLENTAGAELAAAAEEQRQITRLRLEKWLIS